jgi:hypothetical protein
MSPCIGVYLSTILSGQRESCQECIDIATHSLLLLCAVRIRRLLGSCGPKPMCRGAMHIVLHRMYLPLELLVQYQLDPITR